MLAQFPAVISAGCDRIIRLVENIVICYHFDFCIHLANSIFVIFPKHKTIRHLSPLVKES